MRCTRFATAVGVTVLTGSLLALPVRGSAESTPHIPILHAEPAGYGPHAADARAAAAKAFYATRQDAYDFIVLFPVFPLDLSQQSPGEVLGKYWQVRNDVAGIGLGHTDAGADYGSTARLKGVIDVHSLVPGAQQSSIDTALATVAHEVAHQCSRVLSTARLP